MHGQQNIKTVSQIFLFLCVLSMFSLFTYNYAYINYAAA